MSKPKYKSGQIVKITDPIGQQAIDMKGDLVTIEDIVPSDDRNSNVAYHARNAKGNRFFFLESEFSPIDDIKDEEPLNLPVDAPKVEEPTKGAKSTSFEYAEGEVVLVRSYKYSTVPKQFWGKQAVITYIHKTGTAKYETRYSLKFEDGLTTTAFIDEIRPFPTESAQNKAKSADIPVTIDNLPATGKRQTVFTQLSTYVPNAGSPVIVALDDAGQVWRWAHSEGWQRIESPEVSI